LRDDGINIHEPLTALCRLLGLEPRTVSLLEIGPREVAATVYLLDENGKKYVVAGKPARKELLFKVTT
jgi:hypothetical protein